jgi:hypothetical protein
MHMWAHVHHKGTGIAERFTDLCRDVHSSTCMLALLELCKAVAAAPGPAGCDDITPTNALTLTGGHTSEIQGVGMSGWPANSVCSQQTAARAHE